MNPKFHFLCLYGIDYDEDIFLPWCDHYKKYNFDSYNIVLHTPKLEDRENRYAYWTDKFKDIGFNVLKCMQENYWLDGRVRSRALSHFGYSLNPENDYIVCADSDEFQDVPYNYKEIASNYDILEGTLIDRWGDSLTNYDPLKTLDEQYPYSGNFMQTVFREGFYPKIITNKVLCSKAKVTVYYSGSHGYSKGRERYSICKDYDVDHFTYRESLPERMCGKRYFSSELIRYVMQYFKCEHDFPALTLKEEYEGERRKMRNWVAA